MRARIASIAIFFAAVALVLASASSLESAVDRKSPFKFSGDGKISLLDVHTGERISVVYRDDKGRYSDSALEAIDYTLRCHGSGKEIPISLKLIELVDHVQDHFGSDMVKVVSGHRSRAYNKRLRRRLRRVARESLHIHGMAMDIKLPGIQKRQLGNFAKALRSGGVGVYRSSTYVHLDVGPVRHW
jgi:uncharacterized protein YcbK (DUF882 family)